MLRGDGGSELGIHLAWVGWDLHRGSWGWGSALNGAGAVGLKWRSCHRKMGRPQDRLLLLVLRSELDAK